MKKFILVGAASPAFEILDFAQTQPQWSKDYQHIGCFDELLGGEQIFNRLADLPEACAFLVSVGDVSVRERLFTELTKQGHQAVTVIGPQTWISDRAQLDEGCCLYPGVKVAGGVKLEENVLLNFNVSLSHDVRIGAHSNICPGVQIAGYAQLAPNVFVGVGSTISDRVSICEGAYIGAHSLVTEDITEPGVYVGCPVRKIK